jgi:hypothetical protein
MSDPRASRYGQPGVLAGDDTRTLPDLSTGEAIVATRSHARLDAGDEPDVRCAGPGALYVTTRRLVFVSGAKVTAFGLSEIDDAALSAEALFLTLKSGRGVVIAANLMRQLYTTITALRAELQLTAR